MLTHEEALEAAYQAHANLRADGARKVSINKIAARSGVARSVINSKTNEDWIEFRDVVNGKKPSRRAKLVLVEADERKKLAKGSRLLEERLIRCEREVESVKSVSDTIYKKLLKQLHGYLALVQETPAKKAMNFAKAKELNDLKELMLNYKSKYEELLSSPGHITPFARCKVITIYGSVSPQNLGHSDLEELSLDATDQFDDFFFGIDKPLIPSVVYITCGNFASGKSTWIKEHKTLYPGVNLYVDGTSHTRKIRQRFIKRIRKFKARCKIICVRFMVGLDECKARNISAGREKAKTMVSMAIIESMAETLEEVSLDEGFDAIEVVV